MVLNLLILVINVQLNTTTHVKIIDGVVAGYSDQLIIPSNKRVGWLMIVNNNNTS